MTDGARLAQKELNRRRYHRRYQRIRNKLIRRRAYPRSAIARVDYAEVTRRLVQVLWGSAGEPSWEDIRVGARAMLNGPRRVHFDDLKKANKNG